MIESNLNLENDDIFNNFIKYYSKSSVPQYRSSLTRFISKFNIKRIEEINSEHYYSFKEKNLYIEWFIKYLFAFDYLNDDSGFPVNWHKDDIFEHFQNRLKPKKKEQLKEVVLTTDLITRIENELLKIDENSSDFITAVSWYMLFNTDIQVDELKATDCKDFDGIDIVSSKNIKYNIPSKYKNFIIQRMKRNEYTKFQQLHIYVKQIGTMVGIKNLTPKEIKKARDRNMMSCPNCLSTHPAKDEFWFIVDGRIICIDCASENEKKKLKTVNSLQFNKEKHKIDFKNLQELKEKIGKIGEKIVYDFEYKKLHGTIYQEMIDCSKAEDHRNGYDILSYTKLGEKLHIEVKATLYESEEFYITENELSTAKDMISNGQLYKIYRVTNV